MKINQNEISVDILKKILSPDPLEGEDIVIEDQSGKVIGVIIQPKAYEFLLKKIEERENEVDSAKGEKYNKNAPSLDDLMGEL